MERCCRDEMDRSLFRVSDFLADYEIGEMVNCQIAAVGKTAWRSIVFYCIFLFFHQLIVEKHAKVIRQITHNRDVDFGVGDF